MNYFLSLCFLFCSCFSFSSCISGENIKYEILQGEKIQSRLSEIIILCDTIYRQYPYLYNGDDAGYTEYVRSYSASPNSVVILAFANDEAIGIAMGMPMKETREYYTAPFTAHYMDVNDIFYLGEFGIKPEHHQLGISFDMYRQFEEIVRATQKFSTIAFWEILNPMKCEELHQAYRATGFSYHPELSFELWWQNIGETNESAHLAQYWIKSLNIAP